MVRARATMIEFEVKKRVFIQADALPSFIGIILIVLLEQWIVMRKHNRLLVVCLQYVFWNILLVYHKTEGVLVEPWV